MKIFGLVLTLIGFHLPALAIIDSRIKCTPQQMVIVQNPDDKTWHLFVCDDIGLPRGFSKSELTALYNATKVEKDHQAIWAEILGVKKSDVWKKFNELPSIESQTWWDKDKNKHVLEKMAELYKKYVNTKVLEPNQKTEMRDSADYKDVVKYSQIFIAQKCAEQKAEPKRDLNSGEVTCSCNKSTYSNFMDWDCKNGKLNPIKKDSGGQTETVTPVAPETAR